MRTHLTVGCVLVTGLVLALAAPLRAQSGSVDDYVVLAQHLIKAGSVNLIASGNVGVNASGGMLIAKARLASADGTHIVVDTAVLQGPASLNSLWANQTFLKSGVVIRAPDEPADWPPPILPGFPGAPHMSPGTTDVVVERRMTKTLSPGTYGNAKLKTKGTLVFTGGVYNFSTIKTASTARLLFTGPTVVNVADLLSVGNYSIIGPIGPTTLPDDITINVAGVKAVIGGQVTVAARILAPLASLKVGFAGLVKGQLVAAEVKLGSGTVVQAARDLGPFGRRTATATATLIPSPTPTRTATPTLTPTPMPTNTEVPSPTDTPTNTPLPPTPTSTPSSTPTDTPVPVIIAVCGNGHVEGGEECDDGNVIDGDGCSSACRIEHGPLIGSRWCTLTQGAWGAPNGIVNGAQGFLTLHPEILPVTLGGPGEQTTLTGQSAVIAYLPKGGAPTHLEPGERTFATAGDVVPDGGGVLSGQTLALALATNLSSIGVTFTGLSSFILPDLPFCTQGLTAGLDGVLGTTDDELDLSSAVSGPWSLPATVAVANNTVADLLLMANQYLRGGSSVPTIGDVNTALDTINEAFDECRQIVPCP